MCLNEKEEKKLLFSLYSTFPNLVYLQLSECARPLLCYCNACGQLRHCWPHLRMRVIMWCSTKCQEISGCAGGQRACLPSNAINKPTS